MPGEPVTAPAAAAVGLTGKLPAHGDFVRRGDVAATGRFDRWLMAALEEAAGADRDGLSARIAALPPWRFVIADSNTNVDTVLAGAMIASHDRVGRAYPLVAFRALASVEAERWSALAEACLVVVRDAGETADVAVAGLARIVVEAEPDRPSDAQATRWWTERDGVRTAGPAAAFPTGADFAWLLDGTEPTGTEELTA